MGETSVAHRTEIYVCELCGMIIEVLDDGGGTLACCGQEMSPQVANMTDAAKEKHVPVVSIDGTLATIQVGSVCHPMENQHHIVWIDLQQGKHIQRIYLTPGDSPQAVFVIDAGIPVTVRAYCNLHGLWKA